MFADDADVAVLLGLMCFVSSEDCRLTLLNSDESTLVTVPTAKLAEMPMLEAHASLVATIQSLQADNAVPEYVFGVERPGLRAWPPP